MLGRDSTCTESGQFRVHLDYVTKYSVAAACTNSGRKGVKFPRDHELNLNWIRQFPQNMLLDVKAAVHSPNQRRALLYVLQTVAAVNRTKGS